MGPNWIETYTNILEYKTVTSADADNTTFDNNGRPITETGIDGSVTHIDYNPLNGTVADTWLDVAGNGVYTPGVDSKTLYSYSDPSSGDGTTTTTTLSTTGNSVDTTAVSNGGLNSSEITDGLTTSTAISLSSSGETNTTTNPDGTRLTDTYNRGLLASAKTLGPTGTTPITSESYGYDALQRNNSVTD